LLESSFDSHHAAQFFCICLNNPEKHTILASLVSLCITCCLGSSSTDERPSERQYNCSPKQHARASNIAALMNKEMNNTTSPGAVWLELVN
jgi:hypothetical protein